MCQANNKQKSKVLASLTQWEKCLLCKHDDLQSTLQTPVERLTQVHLYSSTGDRNQRVSGAFLPTSSVEVGRYRFTDKQLISTSGLHIYGRAREYRGSSILYSWEDLCSFTYNVILMKKQMENYLLPEGKIILQLNYPRFFLNCLLVKPLQQHCHLLTRSYTERYQDDFFSLKCFGLYLDPKCLHLLQAS